MKHEEEDNLVGFFLHASNLSVRESPRLYQQQLAMFARSYNNNHRYCKHTQGCYSQYGYFVVS